MLAAPVVYILVIVFLMPLHRKFRSATRTVKVLALPFALGFLGCGSTSAGRMKVAVAINFTTHKNKGDGDVGNLSGM